jgi:hypothetical protein
MKLKGIDEMILSKATKFLYFIWIHTYIHRERERGYLTRKDMAISFSLSRMRITIKNYSIKLKTGK